MSGELRHIRRREFLVGLVALPLAGCGTAEPTRSTSSTSATSTPNIVPTQTRAAELTQIAGLQTQVANKPTTVAAAAATTAPTVAPTATPTRVPPTATLGPTSTPVPAKVELEVRNVNSYRSSSTSDSAYIVGEVYNIGQGDAERIQVAVSLLDEAGQTVGAGSVSEYSFPVVLLKPGQKSAFFTYVDKAPKVWKEQRVQVQASPGTNATRNAYSFDLKIEGATLIPAPRPTAATGVTGQILNGGTTSVQNVAVTAGIYDAANKLLAVAEGYAKLDQIPPGGSAPFSVDTYGVQGAPAKIEVFVRGRKVQ